MQPVGAAAVDREHVEITVDEALRAVADPGAGRFPAFALHELEGAFDQVSRASSALPWRRRIEDTALLSIWARSTSSCEAEVDSPPAPRSGG